MLGKFSIYSPKAMHITNYIPQADKVSYSVETDRATEPVLRIRVNFF